MRVAVIGASGFTGLELVKMLIAHPRFQLTYLATSEGNTTLEMLHPALEGVHSCAVLAADADAIAASADLAFLALPHKTSMAVAKGLLARGMKVVDLSADYRLEQERYEAHYTLHEDLENLSQAVYGLPEIYRDEIKEASLVANPGCYPTAAILAVLPFLRWARPGASICIDAKSGVSGAGKKCTDNTHFASLNENMFAYNPLSHRHAPEIAEKLELVSGKSFNVLFVPHLIPVTRGEMVSVYLELTETIDPIATLEEYYADEPFVRVRKEPVRLKYVAGTNFCDIFAMQQGNTLFVTSAIDNLLKGASSAAVVNANLMAGYEETEGIPTIAYVP